MLWAPRDHHLCDPTILRVEDTFHLFYESYERNPAPGKVIRAPYIVCHATSKDLVHWEERPIVLETGPDGAWDGFSIYHMDVFVHDGTWYMHYTGLDRLGDGQKQQIGLATSTDGETWTRHPENPLLIADPRWYEQKIGPESTYQKKDGGRMWFRDPCILRDERTGRWGMAVGARDKAVHHDVRGCVAWAESEDLVHWEPMAPIFSPARFHTIEEPTVLARDGRHYLIWLTHPGWGTPYVTTDPYQNAGTFYAISESGVTGPYRQPNDEILIGSMGTMRFGSARVMKMGPQEYWIYGWVNLGPDAGDAPSKLPARVLPMCKPLQFASDGTMSVGCPPQYEARSGPLKVAVAVPGEVDAVGQGFRQTSQAITGKHFSERRTLLLDGPQAVGDGIFEATIGFVVGERAGLIVRADDAASEGWQVVLDRRLRRVELSLLQGGDSANGAARDQTLGDAPAGGAKVDGAAVIDARGWTVAPEAQLKIVLTGPCAEVYIDGRLMLHSVRHRETEGRLGLMVERGEARFSGLKARAFGD